MRVEPDHEIFKHANEAEKKLAEKRNRELMDSLRAPDSIEIPEEQLNRVLTMDTTERKGWMRNRPCPCGSGKKFKRCHWSTT